MYHLEDFSARESKRVLGAGCVCAIICFTPSVPRAAEDGAWGLNTLVVGICTLELSLAGVSSLKDKRRIIKSLTTRLRREFNISVAEVGALDRWEWSVVGV